MRYLFGFILAGFFSNLCLGQLTTDSNTSVFVVRAPQSNCAVFLEDSVFWLERINKIRVKIKGRKAITVLVENGKITSSDDDGNYCVKFSSPGKTTVTVSERTAFGLKPIYSKNYRVQPPQMYFCGIPENSSAKVLKMKGDHIYAYSRLTKDKINVKSFDMVHVYPNEQDRIKEKEILKSATGMLTDSMKTIVKKFQPHSEEIYFYNIIGVMPDGTKKFLQPIEMFVKVDTAFVKGDIQLIYSVAPKNLYE